MRPWPGATGHPVLHLAGRFTVVRYDKPGCGYSGREGIDLSFGGQIAAALAAGHPDRAEALVLYGACASGRDLAPADVRESMVALVRAHRAWDRGC
jgi:pimeloyl-ACP methyl ester carboxylesterase